MSDLGDSYHSTGLYARAGGRTNSVLVQAGHNTDSVYAGGDGTPGSSSVGRGGVTTSPPPVLPVTSWSSGVEHGTLRDTIRYCAAFVALDLLVPEEPVPLDVIRKHIGRLTKRPALEKQPLTKDMIRSTAWHARMTEAMFRDFCKDRGLGELLGPCSVGHEDGLDYLEFEYLQPASLEARNVDWLDADVSTLVRCGHGTYWETLPWILARGSLTASDDDSSLGEREYEETPGVYMAPDFAIWAGEYSWPCNVFGNKCFYGVGFRAVACDKYLRSTLNSPGSCTGHSRVYDPRGVVLTHIVVTFNRTVPKGHPRSRHFLPRCEFCHGFRPVGRKYPDLRQSVWGDSLWGLPIADTHGDHAGFPFLSLSLSLLLLVVWLLKMFPPKTIKQMETTTPNI